jgi:hypothetical protein
MQVETSNLGTSCVCAYLEIKVPNSSTYILYVITIEMIWEEKHVSYPNFYLDSKYIQLLQICYRKS